MARRAEGGGGGCDPVSHMSFNKIHMSHMHTHVQVLLSVLKECCCCFL